MVSEVGGMQAAAPISIHPERISCSEPSLLSTSNYRKWSSSLCVGFVVGCFETGLEL